MARTRSELLEKRRLEAIASPSPPRPSTAGCAAAPAGVARTRSELLERRRLDRTEALSASSRGLRPQTRGSVMDSMQMQLPSPPPPAAPARAVAPRPATTAIPTVQLNTGAAMPVIGLGTWEMSDADARSAVLDGIRAGYRYIDTAALYGCEAGVGAAVRDAMAEGVGREELFICTKIWCRSHTPADIAAAAAGSLERLGLPWVDLLLLHWPLCGEPLPDPSQQPPIAKVEAIVGHRATPMAEQWRAMEALYSRGLARAIGVSNWRPQMLADLLATAMVVPAVNQIEFHPGVARDVAVVRFCLKYGIQVQAYCPIMRGGGAVNPAVAAVASAHGRSPAQVLLRWALQHGAVPIPKSANPARMAENLRVFDFALAEGEMAAIDAAFPAEQRICDPGQFFGVPF